MNHILRCTLYRTTASKKDPDVQAELIFKGKILNLEALV